jgi:hypothetical protein
MNRSTGTIKTCSFSVFLFGKPAWEMELEGREADAQMAEEMKELGGQLKEQLEHCSGLTRKLLGAGWSGSGGLYDINFYKDTTIEDARAELEALGIDSRDIDIFEEEDEEE